MIAPGKNCRIYAFRQKTIENAFLAQGERLKNAAVGVDDGGDAGIRGADQGEPLFDGAQAGLGQMLVGPGGVAEPAIVGNVQDGTLAQG